MPALRLLLLAGFAGVLLVACTSGTTPDCSGGAAGSCEIVVDAVMDEETGPIEGGEVDAEAEAGDAATTDAADGSSHDSATPRDAGGP